MLVYEIQKKYAPAFADFVPAYILANIGREGFHTLGEFVGIETDMYAAGFLQFFTGGIGKDRYAKITYFYVPEEERGEANAWSLLLEMERVLVSDGIKKAAIYLAGESEAILKPYMTKRGFKEVKTPPPLIVTTVGDLFTDKVINVPESEKVTALGPGSEASVRKILKELPPDELERAGIDVNIAKGSYNEKLSFIYKGVKTRGVLLASVVPEGGVVIKLCRVIGDDKVKPSLRMVSTLGRLLKKKSKADTPVYIPCSNSNTIEALKKYDPGMKIEPVWKGEKIYV